MGLHASAGQHAMTMPTVVVTYDKHSSNVFLGVHILLLISVRCNIHQLLLFYHEPLVMLMFLAGFSLAGMGFIGHRFPQCLLNNPNF